MTYIPAMDGLRALAVLLVVAFHVNLSGFSGGFLGVDAFFVLSGFLITSILRTSGGKIDYAAFLKRRLNRLYPALLLFLLVFAVALPVIWGRNAAIEIMPAALYVSNYTRLLIGQPDVLRHTWSLSVEFQFYLVWPAVVIALVRLSNGRAFATLAILYVALSVWRVVAYDSLGWAWAYYATDTRIGTLVLGSAIAFLPKSTARFGHALDLTAAAALILALVSARYYTLATVFLFEPLAELGCAILVYRLASGRSLFSGGLSLLPLRKIGHWSYGIYLWHYPIAYVLRDMTAPILTFAATISFAIPLAAISYELVETRIRDALRARSNSLYGR